MVAHRTAPEPQEDCTFPWPTFRRLASTDALIRGLHDNPWLAAVCGMDSPDAIPHKSTFSRFFAKLAAHAPALEGAFNAQVEHHRATLPGFGERLAVDSTTMKAWANGNRGKETDPDGA